MIGVFDVSGKCFNNYGIKLTGDELSRATASRNNGAAWIADFVNLRREIIMRGSGSGVEKVTDSLRKAAVRNERIDGVFNYFLMMCGEVYLKIKGRIR